MFSRGRGSFLLATSQTNHTCHLLIAPSWTLSTLTEAWGVWDVAFKIFFCISLSITLSDLGVNLLRHWKTLQKCFKIILQPFWDQHGATVAFSKTLAYVFLIFALCLHTSERSRVSKRQNVCVCSGLHTCWWSVIVQGWWLTASGCNLTVTVTVTDAKFSRQYIYFIFKHNLFSLLWAWTSQHEHLKVVENENKKKEFCNLILDFSWGSKRWFLLQSSIVGLEIILIIDSHSDFFWSKINKALDCHLKIWWKCYQRRVG